MGLSWAILGPLGPSWAYLGSSLQPSCNPTSPLDTFMAELRPPRPHLASMAEPSTCPEHCYLRRFSEVCYLPSSRHVTLNLTLQNHKIRPKSPSRHPKIGTRSPKIAQDSPKMAPKTYSNHRTNQRIICLGTLFWLSWALLAPLGPILGHFRSQVAIQLRLWALPWPN